MSRIPPIDTIQFPDAENSGISTMTTLFRVMGHRPALMQHAMELLTAAMRSGTVDPRLKELLAIRVSQVNHCFY